MIIFQYVNPCRSGAHKCSASATCFKKSKVSTTYAPVQVDTDYVDDLDYYCSCNYGFSGNGFECYVPKIPCENHTCHQNSNCISGLLFSKLFSPIFNWKRNFQLDQPSIFRIQFHHNKLLHRIRLCFEKVQMKYYSSPMIIDNDSLSTLSFFECAYIQGAIYCRQFFG